MRHHYSSNSIRKFACRLIAAAMLLALSPISRLRAADDRAFPFPYVQEDLPNGLRLVTIPTDSQNLVSIYVVVQTGSRNEVEPGKTGFAHLFEHMMFRGTELYPPQKYDAVLTKAGAASNAFTTDDFTAFYTTFSKEDLSQILAMEADRFQNLDYAPEVFKTETGAVLGEFNKDSADPSFKLEEVLADTAFDNSTYKHTTMGFRKDVEDMPNQFDYSRQFFDRYYRPEYATIVVAGAVDPKVVRPLVDKYWGNWKRGSYQAAIPQEHAQNGPRENHVDWPGPTLPLVTIAYHGPAYSDTDKSWAALDALSTLAFSDTSDLYEKLVIREQRVDPLAADFAPHFDPGLFVISARVKHPEDIQYVRDQILATVKQYQTDLVPSQRLANVLAHERYGFALSLNNSQSVAVTAARFIALRRSPDTINKLFALYATLTPDDIRTAARKYLTDDERTIVTLTGKGGAQ
ncbi:MAG TPA: pitrilysin family protein [Candidatus Acidoferrum sp.]|nr:pitrilysin family protein [Candidatus Acidoferrum sp.]